MHPKVPELPGYNLWPAEARFEAGGTAVVITAKGKWWNEAEPAFQGNGMFGSLGDLPPTC